MTQYDAGPGEWSDRPWEDPDKEPTTHAKRRRVTLPPWALLAILVAIVILLCVSLVLIVKAIAGRNATATPTPAPTLTQALAPTSTPEPLITPTLTVTPTDTAELPIDVPLETPSFTEIAPGALVTVEGTLGAGLNLRDQPTTYAKIMGNAPEGSVLQVLDGPKESDGYLWWKLRAPDGAEGWAAVNWLVLKTEP